MPTVILVQTKAERWQHAFGEKSNITKITKDASDTAITIYIYNDNPPSRSACVTPGIPRVREPPQAEIPISPDVASASIENVLHSARSTDRKWRILVSS